MQRKWLVLTALSMESKAIAAELGKEAPDVHPGPHLEVIGIGAKRLTPAMLEGFDTVILAGLAEALDPTLAVGEIVIDRPSDHGKIHTSDHLVATVAEKQRLFRETGCLAVDMEGRIVRGGRVGRLADVEHPGHRRCGRPGTPAANGALDRRSRAGTAFRSCR